MRPDFAQRSVALRPSAMAALGSGMLPWAAGIGVALLMHFVIGPAVGPYFAKIMMDVGIAIVLGVSLNLVNGFTGQFSIGHAGFMAVGGYVAGVVTYYGHHLLWGGLTMQGGFLGASEWLLALGCVVGGLVAALFGFLVGLPSLRLRGDYLAIVTLGFGEILRVTIQQTPDVLMDPTEISNASPLTLLWSVGGSLGFVGLPFLTNLFWVWAAVTAVLVVSYRLKASDIGRGFLSVREDPVAAEAMGIPTTELKVQAFVYSAFFAGIAGGLFAHEVGTTLNPGELGFLKSFEIVIMVVLGGMGSVSGTALAAVVLTVLPELLREVSEYRMIAYSLLLILMMLVRPNGLLGIQEIWETRLFRRKAT